MSILHGARRLAGLAGGTALILGLAGTTAPTASAALGQARSILPVVNHHAAVSWGFNDVGQLGNGTTTTSALYGGVSGLGTGVVQVSAGGRFGLALSAADTVWGWGINTAGELGDGTQFRRLTPVQVKGLTGAIQVSAGADHSLALRSDGTVWAWGADDSGQLGNGVTSASQLTPVEVMGLRGVTKIAAGSGFSLALRSDGTVWAWGANFEGQLGNGTTTSSAVPVQVKGLSQVTNIAAGANASLAIRTNTITTLGSVWAWGGNSEGELSGGTTTNHLTPELVTRITTPSVAGIAAGADFSEALGSDGSVWGWGDDDLGQLGFAAPGTHAVLTPAMVFGAGSPITELSAGHSHTLALDSNGTVLAWGLNGNGELGNGVTSTYPTPPVQVSGLTSVSQVSAGTEFSLAVYLPPQYR